jgi:hypothetical protein
VKFELTLTEWKAVARVGWAASDDPERPAYTCTRLTLSPSRLAAAATDGRVAARNAVRVEGGAVWEGLVPARQALYVERDVRSLERYQSKKDPTDDQIRLQVTIDEEWIEVTVVEDGSLFEAESITRRINLVDAVFPELDDLIDGAVEDALREPGRSAHLDPDLLTRAAKTFDWSLSGAPIRYVFGPVRDDRPRPIVCLSPRASDWAAVVMPVLWGGTEQAAP